MAFSSHHVPLGSGDMDLDMMLLLDTVDEEGALP